MKYTIRTETAAGDLTWCSRRWRCIHKTFVDARSLVRQSLTPHARCISRVRSTAIPAGSLTDQNSVLRQWPQRLLTPWS